MAKKPTINLIGVGTVQCQYMSFSGIQSPDIKRAVKEAAAQATQDCSDILNYYNEKNGTNYDCLSRDYQHSVVSIGQEVFVTVTASAVCG